MRQRARTRRSSSGADMRSERKASKAARSERKASRSAAKSAKSSKSPKEIGGGDLEEVRPCAPRWLPRGAARARARAHLSLSLSLSASLPRGASAGGCVWPPPCPPSVVSACPCVGQGWEEH
eukprot:4027500-Prymnesium_polylepis.1